MSAGRAGLLTGVLLALVAPGAGRAAPAGGLLLRAEAEEWSGQGGGALRIIDRPEASGGKTVSYWEEPGPWLELTFETREAADVLISLGYALAWPDARRRVLLDGRPVGEAVLAGTGSWSVFAVATLPFAPLPLAPGRHVVRFANENSRGLSLDWVALHTTDVFMTDRQLTEAQAADFLRALAPAATGRSSSLARGSVQATFAEDGTLVQARIGDCLLATPPIGALRAAEAPAAGAGTRASVELLATRQHRLAVVRTADETGRRLALWITDGRSLYLAVVADKGHPFPLPTPVLYGDRRRVVTGCTEEGGQLNFAARAWQPEGTGHLMAGAMHLTAAPGLRIGPWTSEAPQAPQATLDLCAWGALRIGAARFSARWGADAPRIGLLAQGTHYLVRETVARYSTLAAFYGEGIFDVEIGKAGTLIFHDLSSGEVINCGDLRGIK